jgi:predicted DCC family thiol-disulfide oxidoreductase YuxK
MQPVYTLLYDGSCPICSGQAKTIASLDTEHHIALLDLHSESVHQRFPHILPDDAQQEIHLIAPDGITTYRGAAAVRQTLLLLPLLRPAGMLMFLPGVMTIARPVYGWVAEHRYFLAGSKTDECEGGTCQPFEITGDR